MGVHGLWELLAPVGRRVSVETLAGKTLAVGTPSNPIPLCFFCSHYLHHQPNKQRRDLLFFFSFADASIWMVQFMKAMRDEKGEMVRNAHLLGFFRRICKLLFLRTKPVFVFDGGTPALKRRTVIARRRQRENAQAKVRKTAEKLLLNHVRAASQKKPNFFFSLFFPAILAHCSVVWKLVESDFSRFTMPQWVKIKSFSLRCIFTLLLWDTLTILGLCFSRHLHACMLVRSNVWKYAFLFCYLLGHLYSINLYIN